MYVRYLIIRGRAVEVTVTRGAAGYAATLRLQGGSDPRSGDRTFQTRADTADAADRAVQEEARAYLERGEGGAGNGI